MIKIRSGSNVPIVVELIWEDGNPMDLTNVSTITMRLKDISTGQVVYTGTCTVVSPSNGRIQHNWGDTSSLNGIYEREFEITYNDGTKETVPSDRIEYIMFW